MLDLYNRIRPKDFKDMIHTSKFIEKADELVDNTLKGIPGVPHVMVFHSAMTPGLGKTTCARILAVKLNPDISEKEAEAIYHGQYSMVCREYNATDMKKPDIEKLMGDISAAGDDLYGYRYVFIINEAHKLTYDSAQLLLSLEDMADNVYVIMTTTKSVAIREDLESRVQLFNFATPNRMITKHFLKEVVEKYGNEYKYASVMEGATGEDHYNIIISNSGGSLRKAIVNLEQIMSTGIVEVVDQDNDNIPSNYKLIDEHVTIWDGILDPERNYRWSKIVISFKSIMDKKSSHGSIPPEEFRKFILYKIQSNLVSNNVITNSIDVNKAFIYSTLIKHLKDPLMHPLQTQLLLRMFQAYMEIVEKYILPNAK